MNASRSVLVIGAGGVLGATVAEVFAERGWLVRRGVRSNRKRVPDPVIIDLDKPGDDLAEVIGSVDLVVNAVPHEGYVPERIVLKEGGRLINIATMQAVRERLLRNEFWSGAKGQVVLNAGLAPGLPSLVVADMLRSYPDADAIEIAVSLSIKGMSGPSGFKLAYDNMTTSGRFGSYSGRHFTTEIPFPKPIGARNCIGFAERDRAWLDGVADSRRVHSFCYFDSKRLHSTILKLNSAGLLADAPVHPLLMGRRGKRAAPTTEPMMHWVALLRDGVRIAVRTIECQGAYYRAALATEVFGAKLFDYGRDQRGCFDPNELFTLNELLDPLRESGIRIVDHAEVLYA